MEYSFVKNGKQPLCVIGDPVAHSLSPAIYNPLIEKYGLNAQYGVMRVPRGDLPRFLAEAAAQGVAGFNATMPHKRDLLALVEGLGPSAQLHGSVNTVVRREGRWIGHSTDGEGFTLSLRRHGLEPSGLRAVLMGAGGAAGAIALQLAQEGVGSLAILNRSVEKAENLGTGENRPFCPVWFHGGGGTGKGGPGGRSAHQRHSSGYGGLRGEFSLL